MANAKHPVRNVALGAVTGVQMRVDTADKWTTAGQAGAAPPIDPGEEPDRAPSALAADGPFPALPVGVDTGPALDAAVRRFVESAFGWQPVDATTSALVPPVVHLVGLDRVEQALATDGVPRILLVSPDTAPSVVAEALVETAALAALAWPDERDQLEAVVGRVLARRRTVTSGAPMLRVGGASGGVGTTTVVLALAGLAGWRGIPTLAGVRLPAPIAMPCRVDTEAFRSPELFARATPVPGVSAMRVVASDGAVPVPEPVDTRIGLAVIDDGVADDVDVLVVRPDRAGIERLERTTAAIIVVAGSGPATDADLARAASGRRGIRLPWSHRVARAGFHQRIPGGLPGSWVMRLAQVVPAAPSAPGARSAPVVSGIRQPGTSSPTTLSGA